MSYTNDSRLGVDDLQWLVFRALFTDLNAAIQDEETRGHVIDDAFNQLTGRRLVAIELDRIRDDNFHMGHRPSLIIAPVSEWPAVAVKTDGVSGSPINANLDQASSSRLVVSIECIVHAGPYKVGGDGQVIGRDKDDGEERVDRRIRRTAEAIHKVMLANRELGGYFSPADQQPTVTFGEVFIRDGSVDGSDRDGRYFWQGVRFQYNYDKTIFFTDQS